jgi:signal transduction histidine kinase
MTAIPFASSLNTKLIVALAGTALAAIALASFLTERSTSSEFRSYVMDQQMMEQHMGGSTNGMEQMMSGPMMGTQENDFLADVRRSLWISGGLAAAGALALGVIISRQITRPVRRLAAATADIARGKLDARVESPGADELGQLGQSFNSMAAALQRQEEERRSMLADIAHELRTPLSVLRGNLEAMLDGLLEPRQEQLSLLHEQSVALSRLIDDLRTLSLAAEGHLDLHRQQTDVAELARRVVAEMEPFARERNVTLSVEAPESLPRLTLDSDRISQVLRNLINNALRYTPAGGRVSVTVSTQPAAMTIAVADTGSGIAPEDLSHVFDRFYRADGSRTRATGGSGLGLAIVKQLVEAHGGQVSAESEPGRGSTFSLALPLR